MTYYVITIKITIVFLSKTIYRCNRLSDLLGHYHGLRLSDYTYCHTIHCLLHRYMSLLSSAIMDCLFSIKTVESLTQLALLNCATIVRVTQRQERKSKENKKFLHYCASLKTYYWASFVYKIKSWFIYWAQARSPTLLTNWFKSCWRR